MTQTNTNYLFQYTRPATDRNVSAPPQGDGDARFDDHLSQASSNSADDSNLTGTKSRGAESTIYNGRQANKKFNRVDGTRDAARPRLNDTSKARSEKSSSSDDANSAYAVKDQKVSTDKVKSDDHDKDDSNSTELQKYGTVEQVVSVSTTAPESAPCADATSTADAAANCAIANLGDEAAANDPSQQPNANATDSADSPVQFESPDLNAVLVASADQATSTPTNIAAATDITTPSKLPVATTNQGEDERSTTNAADPSASDKTNQDEALQVEPTVAVNGETDLSAASVQYTISQSPVSPVSSKPTESKGASDGDGVSKDDPHRDSQSDASADTGNNTVAQLNKANVVPVANVAATSAGDTATNVQSKGDKSDQAVKPATAKSDLTAVAFARLTRTTAGVSRGDGNGTGDMPAIDPARFIGRVAKAFQTAHDRGGSLQLRLSPPELGALRVELTVKDGVMNASLQTENENARRLLLDHLPALRDRLAEQNIRVDRFDVDVRRDGSGNQTDARGSQQQAFQHQPEQPAPRRQPSPQVQTRETVRTEAVPVAPTMSDTGLNLIV